MAVLTLALGIEASVCSCSQRTVFALRAHLATALGVGVFENSDDPANYFPIPKNAKEFLKRHRRCEAISMRVPALMLRAKCVKHMSLLRLP
jgi:hypothetical protein